MIAYWFSKKDGKTDHLSKLAAIGETHTFMGELIPCRQGLYASPTPWDALQYACGPLLWKVEIPDDSVSHGTPINKYVAHCRRYLRCVDLAQTCRQFAAMQALSVIDKWNAPAIVRKYLWDTARGIDRSDIRSIARDAMQGTTWAMGQIIAREAVQDATWRAARDSVRDIWWDAAAGRALVRDTARCVARVQFNEMALAALTGNTKMEPKEG